MRQIPTLREALQSAREQKVAIGHFNISDSTQFNAITTAAEALDVPVLIGVSEGERAFIGLRNAVALVRAAREAGRPVYLNADHTKSVEKCKEAIDAGFDAVMFDGSKLSIDENTAQMKEVVSYARASGRDVIVEGELGYIGSSSKLRDAPPEDMDTAMTTAKEAHTFMQETQADMLAPSVGNLHGMLKGRSNPALNIERVTEISEAADVPLVLHGGSGIEESDFREAIKNGITVVHINTEIRVAYRKGIEERFAEDADQIAPYKYMDKGRDGVAEVVTERIKLFSRM